VCMPLLDVASLSACVDSRTVKMSPPNFRLAMRPAVFESFAAMIRERRFVLSFTGVLLAFARFSLFKLGTPGCSTPTSRVCGGGAGDARARGWVTPYFNGQPRFDKPSSSTG